MSGSQPKARFSSRLPSGDYLTLAVWTGKKDPTAEVLTIQIRHSAGNSWETTGRLTCRLRGATLHALHVMIENALRNVSSRRTSFREKITDFSNTLNEAVVQASCRTM